MITNHTRQGSLLGPPGRLIFGVLDEERSCLEEFTEACDSWLDLALPPLDLGVAGKDCECLSPRRETTSASSSSSSPSSSLPTTNSSTIVLSPSSLQSFISSSSVVASGSADSRLSSSSTRSELSPASMSIVMLSFLPTSVDSTCSTGGG